MAQPQRGHRGAAPRALTSVPDREVEILSKDAILRDELSADRVCVRGDQPVKGVPPA